MGMRQRRPRGGPHVFENHPIHQAAILLQVQQTVAVDGKHVPQFALGEFGRALDMARRFDDHLMGADAPPQMAEPRKGFSVSVQIDDPAEAERAFAALAEGGAVRMPIAETFWALRFGMVTDRFGTPWMVNCARPDFGT